MSEELWKYSGIARMEDRYLNDPVYKTLVDTMYHVMCQGNFTPSELREAAMLAAMKFEALHTKPIFRIERDIF